MRQIKVPQRTYDMSYSSIYKGVDPGCSIPLVYVESNSMQCNTNQMAELQLLQQPALQEALARLTEQFRHGFGSSVPNEPHQPHPCQVHLSPHCLGSWNTPLGTLNHIGYVVDASAQVSYGLFSLDDKLVVLADR